MSAHLTSLIMIILDNSTISFVPTPFHNVCSCKQNLWGWKTWKNIFVTLFLLRKYLSKAWTIYWFLSFYKNKKSWSLERDQQKQKSFWALRAYESEEILFVRFIERQWGLRINRMGACFWSILNFIVLRYSSHSVIWKQTWR